MTAAERKIQRLLAQAHDLSWSCGRYDVCMRVIVALNCLRRLEPRLPGMRDADQKDLDEYADECRVTTGEILNSK
jgi:hypothetical protein